MSAATADLLADTGGSGQAGHECACAAGRGGDDSPVQLAAPNGRPVRSWPLLVLALPAAVAVWSGWVGIGQMTGFGQIHPLPGIWDSLHLNTAGTLPIGVEAYAAYALRAWLATGLSVSGRTRRFAKLSAIASLLLGMAGQVAYHLLTEAGAKHAPWGITMAVSCLPVLVLGMGSALTHMIRADARTGGGNGMATEQVADHPKATRAAADADRTPRSVDRRRDWGQSEAARLTAARAAGRQLDDTKMRVSRRTLRDVGVRGSNADLGTLARIVRSELATEGSGDG